VSLIQLTHFFTNLRKFGGVQSTLNQHLAQDQAWGICSNFVIFFEPRGQPAPRVWNLGLTWHDTIRTARSKFQRQLAQGKTGMAVYHNLWGLPFLADLDGADRRLGLLHTSINMEKSLPAQRGLLDGLLCLSKPLVEIALHSLPELAPDRVALLPSPLAIPEITFEKKLALKERPLVLGYAGRLVKEDKRVDRLPHLVQCAEEAGLNFRLEILGDGPKRSWLKRKFRDSSSVIFHGYQTGSRYWQILSSWDVIVFVSDIEGLPLSLLEALSCGVLPLFPMIGSGADHYVAGVSQQFLYPGGDFPKAAQILKRLTAMEERQVSELRERCRRVVGHHLGHAYFEQFAQFVRRIDQLPRISRSRVGRAPGSWSAFCPFALLRRFYPSRLYR
jgi:glycosyltransferase involved in cell wall biosynthesis